MKEQQYSVYVTLIQILQSKLATALKTYWARASLRDFCKISCTDLFVNLFIKRKLTIRFTAVLLHREFAMSTGTVMAEGLGTPDCPRERWHSWAGLCQAASGRGQ